MNVWAMYEGFNGRQSALAFADLTREKHPEWEIRVIYLARHNRPYWVQWRETVDGPEEWTEVTGTVHRMGCACPQCLSAGAVHVMCGRCEKCTRSACEVHLLCYCGERYGTGPRI